MFRSLFSFCLISLISMQAWARLEIPYSMSKSERQKAIQILGLSTTPKILGNPFPLGGYSGIEVGLAAELINTSEISRLGARGKEQTETSFHYVNLAKGLYKDIDMHLQFSPFSSEEEIKTFGAQLRWGFYQAEYLPAHLSVNFYANTTNFQNIISMVNVGYDLIAGFTVEDVTLYTGIGYVRGSGRFLGNATDLATSYTDTGLTEVESVSESHYLAGINIRFSKLFAAFQLDRFSQASYSAKLGFRF